MFELMHGDSQELIKKLSENSINCVVTSPPYWRLRDYGHEDQLGLEETPEEFIDKLCDLFDDVYRVLKDDGTLYVNLGDSYSNSNSISTTGRKGFFKDQKDLILKKNKCMAKKKSLVGIPAMFQLEMIKRGWILRNRIIWQKTNVMPESVKDRFVNDFEEIFFFTKNQKYYFEQLHEPYSEKTLTAFKNGKVPTSHNYLNSADNNEKGNSKSKMRLGKEWLAVVSDKGRKMRSVWPVGTVGIKEAHFSTFPEEIARRCIQSGCPKDGVVLDPFMGSGTVAVVAKKLGIKCMGFELVESNLEIINSRLERV